MPTYIFHAHVPHHHAKNEVPGPHRGGGGLASSALPSAAAVLGAWLFSRLHGTLRRGVGREVGRYSTSPVLAICLLELPEPTADTNREGWRKRLARQIHKIIKKKKRSYGNQQPTCAATQLRPMHYLPPTLPTTYQPTPRDAVEGKSCLEFSNPSKAREHTRSFSPCSRAPSLPSPSPSLFSLRIVPSHPI